VSYRRLVSGRERGRERERRLERSGVTESSSKDGFLFEI